MPFARVVNPARPVNWSHTLNKSLAGWWMVAPWNTPGGTVLRDLVRGVKTFHNGTLNGPKWAGRRPGGFGALQQAGGTEYTQLGASLIGGETYTVSAWAMTTSVSNYFCLYSAYTSDSNSIEIFTDNTGGRLILGLNAYGGVNQNVTANNSIAANVPFHVILTCSASNVVAYLNGNANGTQHVQNFTTTGVTHYLGRRQATASFSWTGWYDDVRVYDNRALNAAEALALYQQSLRGYPDLLNWAGGRSVAFAPAAAGGVGNPYYYRMLAGAA